MKVRVISTFALLASITINSCKKGGNGQNNNTPPDPSVFITQSPVNILLPNNCQQYFTIKNTGPVGSTMNYSVKDDGALGGFLNVAPGSGSIVSGATATIGVNIKSSFINGNPSLTGSTFILNVYTPNATNYTKTPVSVSVKSIASIAPLYIGTKWTGTWSGLGYGSNNPNQARPTTPVSGTWMLNIQTIDTVTMTAAGSLTWDGTDAYWTYTYDVNGLITSSTPNPFMPNRTIQFDAANATFSYVSSPPYGCSQSEIRLSIDSLLQSFKGNAYAFYGPTFSGVFDIGTNMVYDGAFETHPYPPNTTFSGMSGGSLAGKKQ